MELDDLRGLLRMLNRQKGDDRFPSLADVEAALGRGFSKAEAEQFLGRSLTDEEEFVLEIWRREDRLDTTRSLR